MNDTFGKSLETTLLQVSGCKRRQWDYMTYKASSMILVTSPPPLPSPSLSLLIPERRKGRKREGEKHHHERETSVSCLLHTPYWGPNLQPRHGL